MLTSAGTVFSVTAVATTRTVSSVSQLIVIVPVFCPDVHTGRHIFKHLFRISDFCRNLHFYIPLNGRKIVNVLFRAECIRLAGFSGTRSPSYAVNVIFCFVRQIVVYYHRKVINVNSARCNICCNKHSKTSCLKIVQNLKTFFLRQVANKKTGFKSVDFKAFCNNLARSLRIAENNDACRVFIF